MSRLTGIPPPDDTLEVGRANARCLLRRPSFAIPHHHGVLTDPLAATTAAPDTIRPLSASTHGRLIPPPSPTYRAATAWPNPCRWSGPAGARAGARWRGASRNYNRRGT